MTDESEPAPDGPGPEAARPGAAQGRAGRFSRRRFLQTAGIVAGAVATAGGVTAAVESTGDEPAVSAAANEAAYVLPTGYTGTMADLKHVVILMQENRAFDHYFGQMPGVRGFDDRQALKFQDGTTVFQQRSASGMITTPFQDNGTWGNNHGFTSLDGRRWDSWVTEKGTSCMGYHSAAYMSFYWSLASQYTICDQNFCSELGPTDPNRKYLWSGTANGETGNTDESNYSRTWITVAEQLQDAGIDWRLYSDNSGNGRQGYISTWVGDYGDNELKYFKGFDPNGVPADDPRLAPGTGLIWRGNCQYYSGTTQPNNDSDANLDAVLRDFIAACQPDAQYPLPAVSWIVAPYGWSEHPAADSVHGERYVARVLAALQSNPEIWNHTLFVLTYDENDGKFDHVLPPYAEPGTAGEYSGSTPLGLGPRVPMLLVSPWTRGGYVSSEVFDHTSTIKFLEVWADYLGKPFTCPNISAWRRSVVGDLTSALEFAHPQIGPAAFPDPVAEVPVAVAADHMKPRPLSFHPHATLTEDRATGRVTATLTVSGGPAGKAVGFQVFPDRYQAFTSTPFTVTASSPKQYVWDTAATDGRYAFSIYASDGFVRSFAGQVVPSDRTIGGVPRAEVEFTGGADPTVTVTLRNDGRQPLRYTLTANDYVGGTQDVHVGPGQSSVVHWPTQNGYYDLIITAATGTGWTQRYAGRVATA